MSTARADEHDQAHVDEAVILTPDEEAALVRRLAETDESERTGRLIPWEKLRAERGM